jgi:hypothetical protein
LFTRVLFRASIVQVPQEAGVEVLDHSFLDTFLLVGRFQTSLAQPVEDDALFLADPLREACRRQEHTIPPRVPHTLQYLMMAVMRALSSRESLRWFMVMTHCSLAGLVQLSFS